MSFDIVETQIEPSVDEFGVFDLVDCLRYEDGCLRFDADYIRGRCAQTGIWLRADGSATLRTRCRGPAGGSSERHCG